MKLRLALIVSIVVSGSVLIHADVIYLKNGKKIEGVVRDTGGDEILVDTAGGVFSFKRDTIDRIEESSKLSNLLTQAGGEIIRGNHAQAIFLYSDAVHLAASQKEKDQILSLQETAVGKYVEFLSTRDPLTYGLDDIKQIESVKTVISDPGMLAMLQSAKLQLDNKTVRAHYEEARAQRLRKNYEQAVEHYAIVQKYFPESPLAKGLDKIIIDIYFNWGETEYKRSKTTFDSAQKAFQHVLDRSPDHNMALYYMGLIYLNEKKYDEARTYLSKVNQNQLPTLNIRQYKYAITRVAQALKPIPTPVPRPVFIPSPTPTPVLSKSEKVKNWFSDTWKSIKLFFSKLGDGNFAAFPSLMDVFWKILIGILALILLWYLPLKIVIRDIPKRRVIYYNWRKIVNYTGIFGMILYFVDRLYREEPRKRCPACNRLIDNPEFFDNYEFEICPYCETQIKPPFTIPGLIQTKATGLLRSRSLSDSNFDDAQREQVLDIIQFILIYGRKIRASDIHIEPKEENLFIKYRVDGILTESISTENLLAGLIISCIKVSCNMNIAEKRLPQDGHFFRMLLGEELNIRVSTIPTRLGEKAVLRLLDKQIARASLDQLGFRDGPLSKYRTAIKAPHGLILVTGPTGSGKTTLLYTSLQYINDGSKNITTVEDPIEYELGGINQIQHNTATGLTFATALRSILRQDPDVIMVGEIRDMETASISINSALTGHLVFSTLHTIDTSTALSRLIDIGVEVKLLCSSLHCIIAQRLVRKLCSHCKKKSTVTTKEQKLTGVDSSVFDGQPIYRPNGCRECSNTGYFGRIGIYEIMIPTPEIRGLIESGASTIDIRKASLNAGMKTLREEGLIKVLSGITSLEEVIRVTTEDIFEEDVS